MKNQALGLDLQPEQGSSLMVTPDCMAIVAQSSSNWSTGSSTSTNEEFTSTSEDLVVVLTTDTGSAPILTSKAVIDMSLESRTSGIRLYVLFDWRREASWK